MQKILIIAPSWVGDMVMAQSLFITLKNNQPDCQIDVLAPLWSQGLLVRMPEVTKTFVMPLTHGEFNLKARFLLGIKLRAEKYTQTIVLPNSWKSALIPFFAGIPKRTGFLGEARFGLLNDARKLDKSVLTMTVQRFVALGFEDNKNLPYYSFPALNVTAFQQKNVIEKFHLRLSKPILVLCVRGRNMVWRNGGQKRILPNSLNINSRKVGKFGWLAQKKTNRLPKKLTNSPIGNAKILPVKQI